MSARPTDVRLSGDPVSLRRLSRRFATVGVDIPATRLRQIAESELVDVSFAMVATATLAADRRVKRGRARRRCLHWLIVAGALLTALNLLACLGFVLYLLAQQAHPF
jgi:hypothetical protein